MTHSNNVPPREDAPRSRKAKLVALTGLVLSVALPAVMFAAAQTPTSASAASPARDLPINQQQCAPTATAFGQVNVRYGPSTLYEPPLGTMAAGQSVQVTGRLSDNSWYRVIFNNSEGWVFGNLVATNCMQNVPVVPAPTAPNPTPIPGFNQANFRADLFTVAPGQCTTLRWDIDDVAGVWLIDGQYQYGVGGHDTRQVCPTVTSTYYLRVQRRDGSTFQQSLVVTVNGNQPANQDPNFRADSYSVAPGQCTTLRWSIGDVRAVYFWDGGNQQGVGGSDTRQVCPGNTSVYRLQVIWNNGASNDYYQTITVVGSGNQPNINFTTSNGNIQQGSCTNLNWQVSGSFNSVALVDGVYTTVVGAQGNIQVCPRTSSTYVLRVTGQDGRIYENTVTVNVYSGGGPQPPQP